MIKITIADAITDEVIEREMTQEETIAYDLHLEKHKKLRKDRLAAEKALEEKRKVAAEKLAALGLTVDELTALLG